MQRDQVALDSACSFAFTLGSITPASVAAALCAEQSFLVPAGTPPLKTTDLVSTYNVTPSGNASVMASARVIDATHVGITYCNPTAGALTPAAGVVNCEVTRL